ncbi:MAG: hypothetical protein CO094_01420 [Anaerolineae bacterium CG_4_9_14_3_um_filter_57_17]|nr:hypothetical protein [bacterium]NCT21887.1 hypothetical protein [bacterium]OIO85735.1 MAG: hypothetical protein AUK01_05255 [Anaerolineae bacterium CG2_30_57_67]PJB68358.1 MAG: hypothetical protein CO094_01420 [Anaerolineae bacterium CG_4_9_14_3_um_filter_57_17]
MTGISHQQAKKWIFAALDDLLRPDEAARLEAHLRECAACRELAAAHRALDSRLKSDLRLQPGELPAIATRIQQQGRKIAMFNRFSAGARLSASVILTVFLTLLMSAFFAKMRERAAPAASATQPPRGEILFVRQLSAGQTALASVQVNRPGVETLLTSAENASDYSPIWSPDGQKIFFVRKQNGNSDIWVMSASGAQPTALTNTPGDESIVGLSPDGAKIAYLSGEDINRAGLTVMNADGSDKRQLSDTHQSFASWSPDSRQIAYFGDDGLILLQADGSNTKILLENRFVEQVRWLDARFLVGIVTQAGENPTWTLYRFDSQSAAREELAVSSTPITDWFWDGKRLIHLVKSYNSLAWYESGGQMLNTWHNFAEKCQQYPRDMYIGAPNLWRAPDGLRALASVTCGEGTTWLYLVNADGTQIAPLLNAPLDTWPNGGGISAAWSPDGRLLALIPLTGENSSQFYLLNVAQALADPSTPPQLLSSENSLRFDPVWQPAP